MSQPPREIFPLDANVLDLRRNLTLPYTTVPANTPLYTVADILDLGTSGPFFFDPGRAILWGFYRGINNGSLVPTDLYKYYQTGLANNAFNASKIMPRFEFPGSNQVLLELKADHTVLFDNIILNPHVGVMAISNWTESSLSPMVIGFCNDKSRSAKLSPNLAYYNLATKLASIFNIPSALPYKWIVLNANGTINMEESLSNASRFLKDPMLYTKEMVLRTNMTSYISMPIEPAVYETGIRICRPQEIFRTRSYYPIVWDMVWMAFITYIQKGMNVEQIRQAFLPIVLQLVGLKVEVPDPFFDIPVAVEILKQLNNPKDIIALCSVDRRFKNRVCNSLQVQSLLRDKYLPSIAQEFRIPSTPTAAQFRNILGLPRETKNKKWWNIAPVFFIEDIPYNSWESKQLTGHDLMRQLEANMRDEQDRKARLRPFTVRRHLLESDLESAKSERGKELVRNQIALLKAEEDKAMEVVEIEKIDEDRLQRPKEFKLKADQPPFRKLHLPTYAINKIIRNSNSFMAMFSLIYSMTEYKSMPSTIQITLRLPGSNQPLVQNMLAHQPESLGSAKTGMQLLTMAPRSDPEISIRDISISGSWLHDLDIAPIFLHVDFYANLQKVKAVELQRWRANNELNKINTMLKNSNSTPEILAPAEKITYDRLKASSAELVKNNLIIYRLDAVVAYIVYSSIGGTPTNAQDAAKSLTFDGKFTGSEYVDIHVAVDALDTTTLDIIRSHLLLDPYMTPDIDINKYYKVFTAGLATRTDSQNPYAPIFMLFNSDIITIRFSLAKNKDVSKIYFQVYMYLQSFIRLLFLEESCDMAEWSVNV